MKWFKRARPMPAAIQEPPKRLKRSAVALMMQLEPRIMFDAAAVATAVEAASDAQGAENHAKPPEDAPDAAEYLNTLRSSTRDRPDAVATGEPQRENA